MKPSEIVLSQIHSTTLLYDRKVGEVLDQMAEDIKELKRREELRNLQNNLRIFEEREWEK
jgi:hypothetical protein